MTAPVKSMPTIRMSPSGSLRKSSIGCALSVDDDLPFPPDHPLRKHRDGIRARVEIRAKKEQRWSVTANDFLDASRQEPVFRRANRRIAEN